MRTDLLCKDKATYNKKGLHLGSECFTLQQGSLPGADCALQGLRHELKDIDHVKVAAKLHFHMIDSNLMIPGGVFFPRVALADQRLGSRM